MSCGMMWLPSNPKPLFMVFQFTLPGWNVGDVVTCNNPLPSSLRSPSMAPLTTGTLDWSRKASAVSKTQSIKRVSCLINPTACSGRPQTTVGVCKRAVWNTLANTEDWWLGVSTPNSPPPSSYPGTGTLTGGGGFCCQRYRRAPQAVGPMVAQHPMSLPRQTRNHRCVVRSPPPNAIVFLGWGHWRRVSNAAQHSKTLPLSSLFDYLMALGTGGGDPTLLTPAELGSQYIPI